MCTITNLNLDELTNCLNNTGDSKYLYAEMSISSTQSVIEEMTESLDTTTTSTSTSPVTTATTSEAILSRGQFTTSTIEDFHNANDHSHDSIYDHDETEDGAMEPTYSDKESVTKEKIEVSKLQLDLFSLK